MRRGVVALIVGTLGCHPAPPATRAPAVTCSVDRRDAWAAVPTFAVGDDGDYPTIAAAAAAATPGSVITLAPGTYADDVELATDDVAVVGACREAVRWESAGGNGPLWGRGAGLRVEGVTVASGNQYGLLASGADAEIVDVDVEDSTWWGVALNGATATLDDVTVRRTRCAFEGSTACVALNITGTDVVATHVVLDDNEGHGIYLRDGARLALSESSVTWVTATSGVQTPPGIYAEGSTLVLGPDVAVYGVEGPGINTVDSDVTTVGAVSVDACGNRSVSDTAAVAFLEGGTVDLGPGFEVHDALAHGLGALQIDSFRAEGVVVEGACSVLPDDYGALFLGEVGTVELTDVRVEGGNCPGASFIRSPFTATRLTVADVPGVGVEVSGAGGTFEALSVAEVGGGVEFDGIGLLVGGADVTLTGATIVETRDYGLAAREATITASDLVVAGAGAAGVALVASVGTFTDPRVSGTHPALERAWGGYGFYVSRVDADLASGEGYETPKHEGADLTVTGGSIDGAVGAGVGVGDGATAAIGGLTVSGTTADRGGAADGVQVTRGATATLDAVVTTGGARASVLFDAAGGLVRASTGDEPEGLVQQACDDAPALDLTGQSAGDYAGGIHACEEGVRLPVDPAPMAWTSAVEIDD